MNDTNRFLEGAFAPVTEELTAFDLPVTGHIPEELDGRYLRNGPNPVDVSEPNYHWFLGTGMVHGVRLRGGRAEWYRNRWVRSKEVAQALGEQWPGGPTHDGRDFAANTHVIGFAGRTLATVEAGPLPYELTDELDTIGPCDFGGTLPGAFAAHTKVDVATGELHAVAYYWAWDHVQHIVVSPEGRVVHTNDIPVVDGPMLHDFVLTEHYVVIFDLPVTFDLDLVSAGSRLPYSWNPAHRARVGLVSRAGGEIRWLDVDPCFIWHTFNGYEDGDHVVVDICRYEKAYDPATLSGPGPLTLDRWVIDPIVGRVTTERIDDRYQEFPRIDDRQIGKRHRFGYAAHIAESAAKTISPQFAAGDGGENLLLKHDFENGTVEVHDFGAAAAPGEAIFVPTSPDSDEDDGYVLTFVDGSDRGAADLVILAARDFAGDPVATVHLPGRVPQGLHGNWLPSMGGQE